MLNQIEFRDKIQLVQYLLECPSLATPGARSSTITELPTLIKNQYTRAVVSSSLDEVLGLINACLQFPYAEGLGKLVEIIQLRDKGTIALNQLEQFLGSLVGSKLNTKTFPNTLSSLPLVYVAYSDTDDKWMAQLRNNLQVVEESGKVQFWDRTKIRAGEKWLEKATNALYNSKVAILLVSADFLRVEKNRGWKASCWEIPLIMEAYRSNNLHIIPILASPCLYERSGLAAIQPIEKNALSELPPNKRTIVWRKIIERVEELI